MMSGKLYIDGNDAYEQYGVYVVKGGWNDLIAYPPLKPVECNDWQEIDGVEADLSAPVLNTREVQLKIAISGCYSRFFMLMALLSDGAYHTFNCASIQRKYRLRLTQQPNMSALKMLGTATLKFADDFPMSEYEYIAPKSGVAVAEDYAIDGALFTDYGVRVLKGTFDEIVRTPNVKTNLLRNIGNKPGAIYDGKNVRYKSKDVKIYCLLRAGDLTELWRNYNALLYNLVRPGERRLWVGELKSVFPFYYKSCQVTEFYPDGKIWLQFTLTVTFTVFRI